MAKITVLGTTKEYDKGTTLEKVAEDFQDKYAHRIAVAIENGKIRELFKKVSGDATVEFLTLKDSVGHKAYVRSAIMLMLKSFEDVMGRDQIEYMKVEFVIGNGYYITCKGPSKVTPQVIDKAKARMKELVDKNIPFVKESVPIEDAIDIFKERKMKDKESLFKYRRSSSVNIYSLEDYKDYYYGFMLPSTGYIKWFDVIPYDEGMMLVMPGSSEPEAIKPFDERKNLFETLKATTDWNEKIEVSTVGELNDLVCSGGINDMILVQEALQERRIGAIAEDIVRRGGVKFVMIAGPSSSGKTTFSHRLSVELKTYGLKPHPIPVDDYFVDREKTPRDENGDYNFECLEAIDVEQFNKDMSALLRGERVELPTFNFKTGKREYKGNFKQLGPDDILVIEGIHGLNDKMSYSLPSESKYKIYISALTSINIDEHNRIPTTDGRLLRRMVRDARTRGTSAKNTIKMWPSVRKGEEENIFPFQENADAMFNSILIYELAAFKTYAEPLLFEIGKDEPEYYEAKRLLKFLEYFVGIDPKVVPANSICREFIGGSYFNV
ncbi:MAG: nucleoside kinase [Lachnospiraceae bacterium]|nr:nucleoside kinase [Lachnospiraceae bacterium]